MGYTTISKVRATCGIESGEISDEDVSLLITDAEKEVDRLMNTTYEPKTKIDFLDAELGTNPEIFFTTKQPILRIIKLIIDGTEISPKYVKIYPGGMVKLTSSAEKKVMSNDPQDNYIKYVYGDLEETTTTTTTSDDVTSGDNKSIPVSSSSSFEVGDYVKIQGMDGYSEVTEITEITDSTHITANLSLPHESGSIVTKMQIPQIIVRLTNIVTSLMMVARIVGASYDEIVGYGLEGMNVQKGEPYTQWRETATQLREEYKRILAIKKPKPAVR